MFRIAVVEDEKVCADTLTGYCRRYGSENQQEISVCWYANPVDFLEKYQGDVDLIFMDVLMPMMDGMVCAKRLREMDDTVLLCFVTSMAQYAVRGYEVGALDFMVKPVGYDEFAVKMDRMMRVMKRRPEETVLISSRNSVRNVRTRDLYFVEVYNHSLIYHTADGDYEAYGKLSALEEDDRFRRFIRVSPSHLVNCAHIEAVEDDCLAVRGNRIPISRRRRRECLSRMAVLLGGMG